MASYFKTFLFLLLVKYHLSKWTKYNYTRITVFTEMPSLFDVISSLSLPGWLSSPEGSFEMFLPQEAFSSAVIKGTMQRSTLHRTHSVEVIFVFPCLLFVSSLRTVFPIYRILERSLSCKFVFSVKTIWVVVTAKWSVFFQSHLLSFFLFSWYCRSSSSY